MHVVQMAIPFAMPPGTHQAGLFMGMDEIIGILLKELSGESEDTDVKGDFGKGWTDFYAVDAGGAGSPVDADTWNIHVFAERIGHEIDGMPEFAECF
ncbi:MAG: hypothetical protein D6743_18260 [Calditrichaeota bacterium]|nr:MAG: hypothetical protein D6743_18260 [Calditrichota bacterium]